MAINHQGICPWSQAGWPADQRSTRKARCNSWKRFIIINATSVWASTIAKCNRYDEKRKRFLERRDYEGAQRVRQCEEISRHREYKMRASLQWPNETYNRTRKGYINLFIEPWRIESWQSCRPRGSSLSARWWRWAMESESSFSVRQSWIVWKVIPNLITTFDSFCKLATTFGLSSLTT